MFTAPVCSTGFFVAKTMMNNDSVIEFTLSTRRINAGAAEVLKGVLSQSGFLPYQIVEFSQNEKARVSVYLKSMKAVRLLKRKILAFHLRQVAITVRRLLVRQWRDGWKKNIRPFALTRKFDVVPVWNRRGYRPGKRQPILIDTTLSFGTGLHETTRFMAGLIERSRGKFSSFLDIGTGTGLLAIVAEYCGAQKILALDIDPNSVAAAKKNFLLNHTRHTRLRRMDFTRYRPVDGVDFVAANLVTEDLIAFRKKIVDCVNPGGLLAVSGISLNNLPKLRRAFRIPALRCRKILRGQKWAAVLYQKVER